MPGSGSSVRLAPREPQFEVHSDERCEPNGRARSTSSFTIVASGRHPHSAEPLSVRCRCRHGGCRRTEARANRRIARLALARNLRSWDSPCRAKPRCTSFSARRRLCDLAARSRAGLARPALRPRGSTDRDVARHCHRSRRERRASARGSAGLAGVLDPRRGGCRDAHVLRMRRSAERARRRRASARSCPGRLRDAVIEAVVFDLDGVLDRLRAPLGRGAGRARTRARRPLARTRAGGHDGDELARVVALHARRHRTRASRPRRSTTRSCAGCSRAMRSTCR